MDLMGRGEMGLKQDQGPKRFSALERRYYRWLHSYQECCLTGRHDIELAHTGGYAQGKAMGAKASVMTVLPLARDLHHAEEADRQAFWREVGIKDYLAFAERLFDLFEANEPPHVLYADMRARADLHFMAQILLRSA